MTIKKIPFPPKEDVLCLSPNFRATLQIVITLDNRDEWRITVSKTATCCSYVISWYLGGALHGDWVRDSETLLINNNTDPSKAISRIREWYKNACAEMQKAFEIYVFENYLVAGGNND